VLTNTEAQMISRSSLVAERQSPLRSAYAAAPERARTVKWATTTNGGGADAIHSVVEVGKGFGVSQRVGIDAAVGGDHDLPNPGDLLCTALAACADSTVRMLADVLGVQILDLRVEVQGEVDVRGCLAMGRDLKVGFRSMSCRIDLRVPPDTAPQRIAALRAQGERSCVNLDTLRSGVPVELTFEVRAGS
jgi:uncharacterized OsmC-like protein